MRQVILYPGEDGMWVAEAPSLPGCISQGKTREDALTNIRDAIEAWTGAMQAKGKPIPPERFEAQVFVVDLRTDAA